MGTMRLIRSAALGALAALTAAAAAAEPARPAQLTPIPPDAKVIFSSFRAGETTAFGMRADELYVATLEGLVTRITFAREVGKHFAVSPDRTKIAINRYSRGDSNGDGKLFPLDDFKELWILDLAAGTERKVAPALDAGYGGLSWGPDNRHVYFSTPHGENGMDVFKVDTETEAYAPVTEDLNRLLGIPGKAKFISDIEVSRDGEWLVYLFAPLEWRTRSGSKNRIGIMKLDGSEARLITDGGPLPPQKRGNWGVGDFDPAFAPDGKAVAFARVTDLGMATPTLSTWDIMTVRTDGSGLTRISPEGNDATHGIASWSEEGIIFTEWSLKRGSSILVAAPDGSSLRKLPIGGGDVSHVQWIPDRR